MQKQAKKMPTPDKTPSKSIQGPPSVQQKPCESHRGWSRFFSRNLAAELGGAGGGATGEGGLGVDKGKGGKGKGGKGRKSKGKDEAAGGDGEGENPQDDPVPPAKTLTPLAKAIELKGKVLLNMIFLGIPPYSLDDLFFQYGLRCYLGLPHFSKLKVFHHKVIFLYKHLSIIYIYIYIFFIYTNRYTYLFIFI